MVEPPPPGVRKRGRPKAKAAAADEPGAIDNAQLGILFVDVFSLIALSTLGPHAALAPTERALIIPAVQRLLQRMAPETAAKLGHMGDIGAIVLGLTFWATRVLGQPRPAKAPPAATEPPPEQANGHVEAGALGVPNGIDVRNLLNREGF